MLSLVKSCIDSLHAYVQESTNTIYNADATQLILRPFAQGLHVLQVGFLLVDDCLRTEHAVPESLGANDPALTLEI